MPTTTPLLAGIEEAVPELAAHRRTATRLHPRPGSPAATASSVAGPLLWPADEPWPVCADPHREYVQAARFHDHLRPRRFGDRSPAPVKPLSFTPWQDVRITALIAAGPIPMVPVAQLYRRDVPDLPGPDWADLCQVLWCPMDHDDWWLPAAHVRWRDSASVTETLTEVPVPRYVGHHDYVPQPCAVHPERVTEYEYDALLPEELAMRVAEWEERNGIHYGGGRSIAAGWKVGGYASWTYMGPEPMVCDCGRDLAPLLSAAETEWDDGPWWKPDDADTADPAPTGIAVPCGEGLWIWYCPADVSHPVRVTMQ
ncbi:hypothetical protein LX16_2690 [Stackebrandtia albiflava]|uniref:DUF1963 domain-containing protein n=1 Tax=Stackebrandtia albiflava TaxID=406432 RepID=A0A562V2B0_9ACTN|nr:hypothetical protein [Stackebrandtia albiflava]TWJ11947.1 hypothetical protein LX16_2690 [Stackebrandtia albiflava]